MGRHLQTAAERSPPPPPPGPQCSSQQTLDAPTADPTLHFKCAQFRSRTCCTAAEATNVVRTQLESLSAASTNPACFDLYSARQCAIACDPDAYTWNWADFQNPLLCRSAP